MPEMWVAEDLPAHQVFTDETPPPSGGGVAHTVLVHRSRKSAGMAMGHYLRARARRPHAQSKGLYALLENAGWMFTASGSTTAPVNLALRIGDRVYRVRKEEN